ncbi:MAG TPA: preprotein translocase subunit SecG [Steroidobacteraceae bacterium]|nr:preprotein translocase subunit SecG [Steroidobacteraceae bacterium]HRX91046.1 preprotein translocase subunit SecG [Steroidobacteraceae bacterium]
MLQTALTVVQVFSAVAIVALVLIQRGKGADAGAGFGAGASGTMFGARGATTGLSRATAVFAAVFMFNSLLLTYAFKEGLKQESILDAVPVPTAPAAGSSTSSETAVPAPLTLDAPVPAPVESQGVPLVAPPPGETQPQP